MTCASHGASWQVRQKSSLKASCKALDKDGTVIAEHALDGTSVQCSNELKARDITLKCTGSAATYGDKYVGTLLASR